MQEQFVLISMKKIKQILFNLNPARYFVRIMKRNAGIIVGGLMMICLSAYIFHDKIPFFSADPGNDPVSYWAFDEGTGSTAYDTVGSNDGTFAAGNSAPSWVSEDQCISGKCLRFDGSDDYVQIPSNSTIGNLTSSLTVSGWIRLNSVSGTQRIFGSYRGASHDGFAFGTNGTNLIFTSYSIKDYISSGITLTANRWYYITAVLDSNYDVTFYVDGKQIETVTHNAASVANTDDIFLIGADGTEYFKGYIDEVKVYNYIRSADQIKADYASRGTTKGVSASFGNQDTGKKLSDGLVGYWNMDAGTGTSVADISGNNQTGTLGSGSSAPTWSTGKFGSALLFDGTNDYVGFNASVDPVTGGNPRTISAWVYTTAQNAALVSWGSYSTGQSMELSTNGNGDIILQFYNAGIVDDDGQSVTNKWTHVVATCTGNTVSTCSLWKNGQLAETSTNTTTINTSTTGSLKFGFPVSGTSNILRGTLDEVRIYNRALDPSEVKALYEWAPGPVGWWKMDDNVSGTGQSLNDSSGNANIAGTDDGVNNTGMNCKVQGKFGKGCSFDGSDDYVMIANPTLDDFGTGEMTIQTWVKTTSTIYQLFIDNKGAGSNNAGFNLQMQAGGNVYFRIANGSTQLSLNPGASANVNDGQWHHLAGVLKRDAANDTLYLYKDGVLAGSITNTAGWNITSSTPLYFGAYGSGADTSNLNGSLDDVKIYNYARTPSQIIEDMNAGHPVVGTPVGSTVLHLKMNEGYGSTVNDSSPQGNNGTITGTSAPSWTNNGKFGKALQFDGTDDYVTLPGNLSYGTSDSWSASLWLKEEPGDSDWSFFLGEKGTNGEGILFRSTTNLLQFRGSDLTYVGGPEVDRDQWNHAVVTYSSGTLYIYLNGTQYGPYTLASTMDFTGIGYAYGGDHYFRGSIDEVKIYPFALTEDEVKVDYNAGKSIVLGSTSTGVGGTSPSNSTSREYCIPGDTTTCNAPVGEWKFDEGVGNTANDTSGNANTGTLSGAIWSTGKFGRSAQFDGIDDKVNIGSNSNIDDLASGAFTATAWVKADTMTADQRIFSANSNEGWYAFIEAGRGIDVIVDTDSQNALSRTGTDDFSLDGKWHYVAFTYDNNGDRKIYVYIDGKEISSYVSQVTGTGTVISDASVNKFIGGRGSNNWVWDGKIDQVRYYDYVRTPAQIAWEYNRGAPIAHYQFNECTGSTVYNAARDSNNKPVGNNGTITIAATGSQTSTGTCSSGTGTEAWNNGTTGKLGASISFDGSDDYVSIGDTALLDITDDMSVSVWVKMDTLREQSFVSKWNGPSNNASWSFTTDWASFDEFYLAIDEDGNPAGTYYVISTNANLETGTWYYLTAVWNGTNIMLYKNGMQLSTTTSGSPPSAIFSGAANLNIGAANAGSAALFDGQVDDVKIFNYPLTVDQIKTAMNSGAVRFE